ncbi:MULTISPECIES: Gfo/Idh/MocA family protein [Aestuariimicrobium]|uniref:Gfo/Idh/MocA family protein n=1 Tax=Aestuariimicrobium TaxID=396388 RepID=UPI0003B7B895|nr:MULTISPECIES: Gfo/Idh/MocA family oxidoreductase [Aestuariimicrobium]CAI9406766.1 Inositol 2-dehydrogenase/D-chiro-inositol 3-dehydrogenase [Aestuariimicrobium sp. T2.26MG-19.2B]
MNDLRIAVIGHGMRASLAKLAHKPGEGSRVTVIVEPTDRGLDDARKFYDDQVTYLRSVDELMERDDVDAAMVFTPDNVHFEVAMRTLEKGWPTFCEKPMGITIEQCDSMLELAHEKRTRLYIGHNMRHMPVVRQLKRLIDEGAVGNVKAIWTRHFVGAGGDFYFKDWHADRANVTSLLLQKGAHDIDVMHHLAGSYTRRVSGIGDLMVYGDIASRRDNTDRRMWDWYDADVFPPTTQTDLNPVVDVEDISMLHMVLESGVLASYEQCHFTPDYWRNYTVIGDAGRIENMSDDGGGQIHIWNSRRGGAGQPDAVEVISRGDGTHAGADPNLVAEFLRFAREGGATDVSAIAAREAVATGCVGAESIRTGGAMLPVPPVAEHLRAYFDGGQV